MERAIVSFELDEEGDWTARLNCGHRQHVRHQPPFINRPWVMTPAGRESMRGTSLNCVRCDRRELPLELQRIQLIQFRQSDDFPAELGQGHATAIGVWSQLRVHQGQVRLWLQTLEPAELTLVASEQISIPPQVRFQLKPGSDAQFDLEYLAYHG